MKRLLLGGALAVLALASFGCGEEPPVQIGAVLPLTGDSAIYGTPIRNGVELAFETIRAREGYPFTLELVVEDTQSDPAKARAALEEVLDRGTQWVIGGVTSSEALEMVDVADQQGRVLISPSASSPELTGISKNFYRVFPSDALEGGRMGNFATQTLELETIVVLSSDSAYGRGIQQVFKGEFERYGGKVIEVLEYPANLTDFSGLIERVMSLKPEAVYLADLAGPVGVMVQALNEGGFRGRVLTTSAFASPEALAAAGSAAEGIFITKPVFEAESEDPLVSEFVAAYRAKYDSTPGLYAAHGYDAMQLIAAALENTTRPSVNEFRKGLRRLQEYTGVTGLIQFDEKGDVQKYPRVYIMQSGELLDYDKFVAEKRERIRQRLEALRKARKATGS